jgi:hypothetical protein
LAVKGESAIFAFLKLKQTTMNSKQNTLTPRCDFMISPPPLTYINTEAFASIFTYLNALLHLACALCGRVSSVLSIHARVAMSGNQTVNIQTARQRLVQMGGLKNSFSLYSFTVREHRGASFMFQG